MGTGLVRTGGSKRAPTRDLLYNEEVDERNAVADMRALNLQAIQDASRRQPVNSGSATVPDRRMPAGPGITPPHTLQQLKHPKEEQCRSPPQGVKRAQAVAASGVPTDPRHSRHRDKTQPKGPAAALVAFRL
eukprot:jgi/Chrzof1/5522/Cz16g06070.t1